MKTIEQLLNNFINNEELSDQEIDTLLESFSEAYTITEKIAFSDTHSSIINKVSKILEDTE
jgi:L-arabinose isomerase